MHRADKEKWPEEFEPENRRSRPGSRRNSAGSSVSRRNSLKRESSERPRKQNPQKPALNSSTSNSSQSTPKRAVQKRDSPQNVDFVVTGKQILKKSDRANSLPSAYHRRPSAESLINSKTRPRTDTKKNASASSKSRETSLEDDMSLDLSQVSDFEDTNSKYGIPRKVGMVTSTPKCNAKARSGSVQSQRSKVLEQPRKGQDSVGSSKNSSNFSCSRDSLYKTSSTASGRYGRSMELDYSSVSPEYSGQSQSSADLSPRTSVMHSDVAVVSPFSQRSQLSGSSCYLSWVDSAEEKTKVAAKLSENGEWNNFWANYNNSVSRVPIKSYYDQCPTPYRTEDIDLADLDLNAEEAVEGRDSRSLNHIIRNEGLQLTPRETQNVIKCAHILGNVLSKAIDRKTKVAEYEKIKIKLGLKETDVEGKIEEKRKGLKLDLKEESKPLEVETAESRVKETVTTQTDISLPNTKSAPRIFENILRQLSRSSITETSEVVEEEMESEKKIEDGADEKKVE